MYDKQITNKKNPMGKHFQSRQNSEAVDLVSMFKRLTSE